MAAAAGNGVSTRLAVDRAAAVDPPDLPEGVEAHAGLGSQLMPDRDKDSKN